MKVTGYNQITNLATAQVCATGLTGNVAPATSKYALVQAEAQNVRWRGDGTDPTATVGELLAAGDSMMLSRAEYQKIKFILATSGAILNTTFYTC